MRRLLPILLLTLAVLLVGALVNWRANLLKGLAADTDGDYATALPALKSLAEKKGALSFFYSKEDVVIAQYKLGLMYEEGRGVPQDASTAVKWYTLAAEQGNAEAPFRLGEMYDYGWDIPQDTRAAVKWYTLAAKNGHDGAQYLLKERQQKMAEQKGLDAYRSEDYATALRELKPLAEQGYAIAQTSLGLMYEYGKGVPQDNKTAMKWYTLAGKQPGLSIPEIYCYDYVNKKRYSLPCENPEDIGVGDEKTAEEIFDCSKENTKEENTICSNLLKTTEKLSKFFPSEGVKEILLTILYPIFQNGYNTCEEYRSGKFIFSKDAVILTDISNDRIKDIIIDHYHTRCENDFTMFATNGGNSVSFFINPTNQKKGRVYNLWMMGYGIVKWKGKDVLKAYHKGFSCNAVGSRGCYSIHSIKNGIPLTRNTLTTTVRH